MSRIKIYKEEVPINRPCHVYTENKYHLIDLMNTLTPQYSGKNLLRMKLDFDTTKLLKDIRVATFKHKWWGWINKNTGTLRDEADKIRRAREGHDFLNRSSYYGGWSIKSNPIYCQSQGLTPEGAGMGELPSPISWFLFSSVGADVYQVLEESQELLPLTRIAVEQGYKAVLARLVEKGLITTEQAGDIVLPEEEKLSPYHKEKDGYFDSWGFTEWSNAATESGVRALAESANCQLLRSRVAWQRGAFRDYKITKGKHEEENDRWTWHSDEPVCHNARIIIPVQTSPAYAMEIKPHPPEVLETGYAYTWDTNIVHRQIQIDNTDKTDRIYVVLGFNPWFNWLPNEQAWESNDFYGKMHPLDMIIGGHILPSVTFDKEIL